MATLAEVIQGLEQKLKDRSDKLAAAPGAYQLELTGEGGGTYALKVANGAATLTEEPLTDPGVVLTMSVPDFISLATGKLNGMTAFMSGKLRIKGDMGLALKLQSILF